MMCRKMALLMGVSQTFFLLSGPTISSGILRFRKEANATPTLCLIGLPKHLIKWRFDHLNMLCERIPYSFFLFMCAISRILFSFLSFLFILSFFFRSSAIQSLSLSDICSPASYQHSNKNINSKTCAPSPWAVEWNPTKPEWKRTNIKYHKRYLEMQQE